MNSVILTLLLCFTFTASLFGQEPEPEKKVPTVVHPSISGSVVSTCGSLRITLTSKRQNYGGAANTRDNAIFSPKSVNIHPDNSKYYVNSLEGGTTVVFEMGTNRRLKVINHRIGSAHDSLWSESSPLYRFEHYRKNNHFMGKPVEAVFSHNGRYLWVPYYKRSYDINAQDPSAVAVIDTQSDEIVRLMETGPLPKMIAVSHDNRTIAVSHWGNNTVGIINIESDNPMEWHHSKLYVVDYVLPLNYSLTTHINRDNGSGYALRGTVFTPDDRYLLVGCMGGGGGIAVIDMQEQKYLGRVKGMMVGVRHLVISNGYLYLSINGSGYVQRIELDKFIDAATHITQKSIDLNGWTSCKVGAGARTIAVSPCGKYIFAACNIASKLYVVDAEQMKVLATAPVDSFPVGLDVSSCGDTLITTSQGRSGYGGNAVDIFSIEYLK
ncbi:MAG: beta-propeller fold lactonase family protein [Alistipes sp.]|nr:beta-propeller fold lactonase family protein [Alistipes sp.]